LGGLRRDLGALPAHRRRDRNGGAFGIRVDPPLDDSSTLSANFGIDPDCGADIRRIIDDWLPLTVALNSLNRCMGRPDLYPLIISPPVVEKLAFIHGLVRDARR
jgi:hypothetical protein